MNVLQRPNTEQSRRAAKAAHVKLHCPACRTAKSRTAFRWTGIALSDTCRKCQKEAA